MAVTATSQIQHPLVQGLPPDWASGWGQDRHGIFLEFCIPAHQTISQRMRWIPPGRFTMGSPDDESGRDSDEGPTHEVTINKGFWLFDTPCTQGLWCAVMGQNPSRFVDDARPVEQVSWDDCQSFMQRIAELVDGLTLTLPTEAQWEYACRAGTETATYAGDMEIIGTNNAPVLDPIAWYGGNSGERFDLDAGEDSSDWPEKQYDHRLAGTRKVGRKKPNGWGLYDMLGNVWEWCLDGQRVYSRIAATDPVGPTEAGTLRVFRGGSWSNHAQDVRSAFRYASVPGFRFSSLGFRCALVQEPS